MKTISIINLKGGVAKTISAINIAYTLTRKNFNVLLVDNDKQGNASKFFGVHDDDKKSIADVLTDKDIKLPDVIQPTEFKGLEILPANMNLLAADKMVLIDTTRRQQPRLKKALQTVNTIYDFVIIDNAPDLSMSNINSIVASDDILIPIKIDNFALDGLKQLLEHIREIKADFNPGLRIAGGFVTMYQKNNVNTTGIEHLRDTSPIPVMSAVISKTVKVDESTFTGKPLLLYAPKTAAANDYIRLTEEYLRYLKKWANISPKQGGGYFG